MSLAINFEANSGFSTRLSQRNCGSLDYNGKTSDNSNSFFALGTVNDNVNFEISTEAKVLKTECAVRSLRRGKDLESLKSPRLEK